MPQIDLIRCIDAEMKNAKEAKAIKSSHPNDLPQKQCSPSCTLKTGSSAFIYFLGPTSELSEQPSGHCVSGAQEKRSRSFPRPFLCVFDALAPSERAGGEAERAFHILSVLQRAASQPALARPELRKKLRGEEEANSAGGWVGGTQFARAASAARHPQALATPHCSLFIVSPPVSALAA